MPHAGRADAFARLLGDLRAHLKLEIGFRLWNGATVPEVLAPDALCISIADEGAVAALLRRPKLDTLANLWVSGRLDLHNGTIFDLAERRPKLKAKAALKALGLGRVARVALQFALVPRGGPFPLEAVGDPAQGGTAAANTRNVQHHYDVSNDFYRLFLDPEMVYSCGYFRDWQNDLATAQHDKLEMICRKLRLQPGERFLDVGCGWGALVCHAAQHHGVRAHGVTLSAAQLALAQDKVKRLGLQDRITLELRDFNDLDGEFDKIASIGMFEHVGIANHARYFTAINRLLKPGGLYLHHAIARPAKRTEQDFRRRKPEYAALTRYIFPGGELDHVGMSVANLQRHGFEVHDVEAWREHYARTCRLWHDNLLANTEAATAAASRVTVRLWLIYLAGCSLAFARNTVGIYQTLASRRVRGPAALPPTRADLYRGD